MDNDGRQNLLSETGQASAASSDHKLRFGTCWPWCSCFIFSLGPVILVVGLWMLFTMSDTRLARVTEYMDAVQRWEAVRQSFVGLDIRVSSVSEDEPFLGILPPPEGVAPSPLDPLLPPAQPLFSKPHPPAGEVGRGFPYVLNFTSSVLHQEEQDHYMLDMDLAKLEDYQPLFYTSEDTQFPVGSFGYLVTVKDRYKTQVVRINHVPPISSRTMRLLDCLKQRCDPNSRESRCRKLTSCEQACILRGGNYMGDDMCQFYAKLESVCIVLSRTAMDQWDAITNHGRQMGCYFESRNSADNVGTFNPAIYADRKVGSVRVELRHAADPHIAASRLTLGAYDFGPSWWEKFAFAMLVIIVGAIWTTSVSVVTCFVGRSFKRIFWPCFGHEEERENEYRRILDHSDESRFVALPYPAYGSMDASQVSGQTLLPPSLGHHASEQPYQPRHPDVYQ